MRSHKKASFGLQNVIVLGSQGTRPDSLTYLDRKKRVAKYISKGKATVVQRAYQMKFLYRPSSLHGCSAVRTLEDDMHISDVNYLPPTYLKTYP